MSSPDILDIAPVEVHAPAAPAPKPAGAPAEPKHVIAAALSALPQAQALRVADELVLALAANGWWFGHDSQPGKKTRYGVKPAAAAGER